MHQFWVSVIHPLVCIVKPKVIVEIGSDYGDNTANLLGYAQDNDAVVHVIDPLPKYSVDEWREKYGKTLIFHRQLSLNVLSTIDSMNMVLIDGDHNWYTVYNELKLIEKRARKSSSSFPLVFLHDVGWPYGRRDLYYCPEAVPEAYRKPYAKKGMKPGEAGLVEKGGLNAHLFNSIYEHDAQNGVLTGVEDFMAEGGKEYRLIEIPVMYGLGVLFSKQLPESNAPFRDWLEGIRSAEACRPVMEATERERLSDHIQAEEMKHVLADRVEEVRAAREQASILRGGIEDKERASQARDRKISEVKTELAEAQRREEAARGETRVLLGEIEEKERSLRERDRNIAALKVELVEMERREATSRKQLSWQTADIRQLDQWFGQLYGDVDALEASARWKLGHNAIRLAERALLRGVPPNVMDHMHSIFDRYQDWKKNIARNEFLIPLPSERGVPAVQTREGDSAKLRVRRPWPLVDIVICVHNALKDVRCCLESVLRNTGIPYLLHIVNDGSRPEVTEYLREFSHGRQWIDMLQHEQPRGYTRAANEGLRMTQGDYIVLLNSDTIVPPGWLQRILECGAADCKVGLIGPVSNAASWQSVPQLLDARGDLSVNTLPVGWTVDQMDALVCQLSERRFPRVTFVNGFCFVIKREVINRIGYLDEETFPRGYGEENDYCIRARNAGFSLAIADHVYVYHAKSRSFGHSARQKYSRLGSNGLRKKYPAKDISALVKDVRFEPNLARLRERIAERLAELSPTQLRPRTTQAAILFLLPVRGGGGGSHSVVQESLGLVRLGLAVQIAIKQSNEHHFRRNYARVFQTNPELFFSYGSEQDLAEHAQGFQVVVATVFHSITSLARAVKSDKGILPAYYIQDYEPWFFEEGTLEWKRASNSYTMIPGCVLFAKTQWLCEMIHARHGVRVEKVCASIDRDVYFPVVDLVRTRWPVHLTAMIRPATPRRGATRTMRVLSELKREFGERLIVNTFGCNDGDSDYLSLERDFPFHHHGLLTREEVAGLLRASDIFIDLSDYQAFGRTGLEAMASGCVAVVPGRGGASEYARHGVNSLVVDTESEASCVDAVRELLVNCDLREDLRREGILTASSYSLESAALSEWLVFSRRLKEQSVHPRPQRQAGRAGVRDVCGLLPGAASGGIPGSGYVRVVLPLTHGSVQDRIRYKTCSVGDLMAQGPDAVIVQRTALPTEGAAASVLEHCEAHAIDTVFEIDDDLFRVPHTHREGDKYRQAAAGAMLFAMNARTVTVSTQKLAERLRSINPNIIVLQNALDETLWLRGPEMPRRQSESETVHILYMGTATHGDDLVVVEDAIKILKEQYPARVNVDMVGVVPAATRIECARKIAIPKDAASNYPAFVKWLRKVNRWDIGIAPLRETEFNDCKSHIKYLDYSALGLASVCSRFGEYASTVTDGESGLLVANTTEAWLGALTLLVEDRELRQGIAERARETLEQCYTLANQARNFGAIY